jgi:hypothetical protein
MPGTTRRYGVEEVRGKCVSYTITLVVPLERYLRWYDLYLIENRAFLFSMLHSSSNRHR